MHRAVIIPRPKSTIAIQPRLVDTRFVRLRDLTPIRSQRILACAVVGWKRHSCAARTKHQDLLCGKRVRLHPLHYGPSGRGYQSVPIIKLEQCNERYPAPNSRLSLFATMFAKLLDHAAGDTFVDMDCVNDHYIFRLAVYFQQWAIVDIDFSNEALGLARERESPESLSARAVDITDLALLNALLDSLVDHIVRLHVAWVPFALSRAETVALRHVVVDRRLALSSKSDTIIDDFGPSGSTGVIIRQGIRAVVSDDGLHCFTNRVTGWTVMKKL